MRFTEYRVKPFRWGRLDEDSGIPEMSLTDLGFDDTSYEVMMKFVDREDDSDESDNGKTSSEDISFLAVFPEWHLLSPATPSYSTALHT